MKDKFSKFSLPLLWIFAFLVIIFIMVFTVHAEEPIIYDGSLPFTYAGIENYNSWLTDDFLDYVTSYPNLPFDDDDYVLVYVDNGFIGRHDSIYFTFNFYFYLVPISNFSNVSTDYNFFQDSLSYSVVSNKTVYFVSVSCDYITSSAEPVNFNSVSYTSNPSGFNPTMFGYVSVTDHAILTQDYTYVFTSYAPVYFVKDYYSSNSNLVLKFTSGNPIVDTGVAIIPPSAITPVYPSGTTAPVTVPPTYTTTDYTWTTPPTFDGSSVENALGSIQNLLGWLGNNLKEEFKNLTSNLKGFFEYIGQTIQYYGNAILQTLNNFIQNFYDNMAALVQPIFDKVNYITSPIDSDSISTAFNQNGLISVKNDFIDFFNDFDYILRNTQEPDTFDITINIQNVRTFYNFGCRSPVVLHLGNNLNGTTKTVFRAFLWVLVIVGSIFLTEKNLSAWIKGGGFSDK